MLLPRFLGIILCITSTLRLLSQNNSTSVDIIPHWKQDETHSVKIKSTTTESEANNNKAQTCISTFEVMCKVLEVSDSGYKIEWAYVASKSAAAETVPENQILSKLKQAKFIVQLSATGQVVGLINVTETRSAANKVLDELILNSTSPAFTTEYKGIKQLISSKQGLETVLLKHIKIYTFSFGYSYTLDVIQTHKIKFPNPFGGQAFDAIGKVQLTKLDKANSTCVIETTKTIDGDMVKSAVINYVKTIPGTDLKEMNKQIGKADLKITETTVQQVNFSKGLVQKSSFKRTMVLGIQNTITELELETID